ncbi:MAG: hypothetical protein EU532_10680, partial [Promethearchaeota archaeon]
MKNFTIKANSIILTFILLNYVISPYLEISLRLNTNTYSFNNQYFLNQFSGDYNSEIDENLISEQNKMSLNDWDTWDGMVLKYDKNGNEINDQFDNKLYFLSEFDGIDKTDNFNNINFIIQFQDDYDYTHVIVIFKNYGGNLKCTYKEAINGF